MDTKNDTEIHWRVLVSDLHMHLTFAQIGDEVGTHASQVWKIQSGDIVEPRYGIGCKLINLHKTLCKDRDRNK